MESAAIDVLLSWKRGELNVQLGMEWVRRVATVIIGPTKSSVRRNVSNLGLATTGTIADRLEPDGTYSLTTVVYLMSSKVEISEIVIGHDVVAELHASRLKRITTLEIIV